MDTTDFMQKLSQHAQQTGELMEEAVRQMEMLQAETEHYKKYAPGNEWYISVKEHNRVVNRLQAELEQAKAERDAAIKDLRHNDNCDICIGSKNEPEGCDCECLNCQLDCRCRDCRNESKWQWRGVKEG